MPSRTPIWIAAAANLMVAGATLLLSGWRSAGLHAAARNTARFSMLCFMAGLAAPGLTRWIRALPSETRLIQAFVAAHLVHFAVVALLLGSFERAHIAGNPLQAAIVIVFGSGFVIGLGVTAAPRASRGCRVFRYLALYVIFLLFFAASVKNPVKPLRISAVLLFFALLLRLTSKLRLGQTPITSANQSH